MTAAGTFALDTNTYLTAESDTLASVTGRGNTTTNFITIGGLTANQSVTASGGIARGNYLNNTLIASANGDTLVGLDIQPTFTNGAFTGVSQFALRCSGTIRGSIFDSAANLRFSSGTSTSYVSFLLNQTALEVGRFHGTTGNLTLQNGGTFTDAGFRLDVVGADSRFNGIRAGLGAGQVASNTVFGNGALNANTTGANNTAVGQFSLSSTTTGVNNTAIGHNSLLSNSTGSNNTAIGVATSTGNFSGSVILGVSATATASNQFVVGSATTIAGAVTTETNTSTQVWNVIINGVARKILLA
jgi:hypothetical protein